MTGKSTRNLLNLHQVQAATGLNGATVYKKMKSGGFPLSVKDRLPGTKTRKWWHQTEIEAYMEGRYAPRCTAITLGWKDVQRGLEDPGHPCRKPPFKKYHGMYLCSQHAKMQGFAPTSGKKMPMPPLSPDPEVHPCVMWVGDKANRTRCGKLETTYSNPHWHCAEHFPRKPVLGVDPDRPAPSPNSFKVDFHDACTKLIEEEVLNILAVLHASAGDLDAIEYQKSGLRLALLAIRRHLHNEDEERL